MADAPEIQIQNDVPLPEKKPATRKWPLAVMKVGDSFLVPSGVKIDNLRRAASYTRLTKGMRFSVRSTPEGYRCWRVA